MNNVVLKDDEEYPELLRQTGKEAPKQIYCKFKTKNENSHSEFSPRFTLKGSDASKKIQNTRSLVSLFSSPCLSVIGSRRLTSYGKQALEQLVGQIAGAGITIVSGFMYGGDAIAHETAVKVGGRTIAVMPCGIDRIHPQDQEELYQDILNNQGLIISEYEGDIQPTLWTYPRRNRIVAGLSKALLIVEAGEKSGCLITANYAKKFKRKIFVVPGPITSSVSKGSNLLIKQGAEMVTEARDVLGWFRASDGGGGQTFTEGLTSNGKIRPPENNNFEKQVLEMLAREPLGVDELSRELEMSSAELGVKLSLMEMQSLIEKRGNKYGSK